MTSDTASTASSQSSFLLNSLENSEVRPQNEPVVIPAHDHEALNNVLGVEFFLLAGITPGLQLMILKYCEHEFVQGNPYIVAGFAANMLFFLLYLFLSLSLILTGLTENSPCHSRLYKTLLDIYAPISPFPSQSWCDSKLPLWFHPQFAGFVFSIFIATLYSVQYASEHISLSLDKKNINQAIVVAEITPATVFLLTSLALHLMNGASKIKNKCHARFFQSNAESQTTEPLLLSKA